MEIVEFGGWERCARFTSGSVEMLVTLDVGPRIIRLATLDGPNELAEYRKDFGKVGGTEYRSYGGHRLWTAPEDRVRTYEPDNDPVGVNEFHDGVEFVAEPRYTGLRRAIRVRPKDNGMFVLDHVVTNIGDSTETIAPWCLTVMATGGTCVFPQPPFRKHHEELLPASPLVLWHYTQMQDPRWIWGNRLVQFRQDETLGPQKIGAFVHQGWAAYQNHGNVFLKRFGADCASTYPDFGCNFETFAREDMLEVESLGPLTALHPGESAIHTEVWRLIVGAQLPADEPAALAVLTTWANELTLT